MPAPTRLGKYEIRRELGKGSMGVVYEAYDPVIERRVAIKVIRQDELGAAQSADLIARLKREAQAAGRLNHPGIVSIHDFGEDATLGGSGIAYIAMELVEGRELKELYDAGRRFTPAESARIVGELLAALQHAHDRGVTHRDIKPGNVILLADGGVKLADFGVARIEASELTQAGTIIGTPMYMAPEQILGLAVDGRADVFSCGVLLYELLTGTRPFSGSVTTVIQQVLNVDPAPPSRVNAALGPEWDALISRALAKKPEERFASAREMAEALRRTIAQHLNDATVVLPAQAPAAAATSAPGAAPRPAAQTSTPASARPAAATGADRPATKRPRMLVLGAAGAVAAGMAYLALRPAAAPPAPPVPSVAGAASQPEPAAASTAPAIASVAAALPAPPTPAQAPPAVPAPAPASVPAAVPAPAPVAKAHPAPPPPSVPRPAAPAPAPTIARAPDKPAPAAPATATPAPAPKPATPPATDDPAAEARKTDWALRVGRLESVRGRASLTLALRRLLEPLEPRERQTLLEFEAMLRQQPHAALAFGMKRGYISYAWSRGSPDAEAAAAAARKRCTERHAVACHVVLVDDQVQLDNLLRVARELGAVPADKVLAALVTAFTGSLETVAREQAQAARATTSAASAPSPSAPAPASPAPPPPTAKGPDNPAAGWAQARSALRAATGSKDLARALALMLQVTADADRGTLDRLQAHVERMRWNSALAIGDANGFAAWGLAQGEQRAEWAAEQARNQCAAGRPRVNCVVVWANGEFKPDGLQAVAAQLGSRSQAETREAFLRSAIRFLGR